jgi:Fe-S cluster biogenesis protein NfuA
MNTVRIEPTPNPNALKFMVDQKLMDFGSRSYPDAGAANGDSLAAQLFAIPDVESVFYMTDIVTISKTEAGDWDSIVGQVRSVLDSYNTNGAAEVSASPTENGSTGSTEENDLLERISLIIDKKVKPALAADGGGLELLGLNDYTLRVRYHGACGSCPSSTAGTLRAIGNLLKNEVDERLVVVPG